MTTSGSVVVAERYARALLDVVLEKKLDPAKIGAELDEVAEFLSKEEKLAEVLASPTLASDKRVAILDQLLENQSFDGCTVNTLRLLAARERMPLLPLVARQYGRLVLDHQGIQSGQVVSAGTLTSDQQERLAKSLGSALGKTMELTYDTDPALVGGLVVRIGNRVYDASVVAQLKRFKEKALSSL